MNHHNSKSIQMDIKNTTEKDMSQTLLNEEFSCIFCFDSLSSMIAKKEGL